MRIILVSMVLGLCSVVSNVPAFANDLCKTPIKAGWESYEPWQYKEAGTLTGIDVDYFNAMAADIGCKVEWLEMPWARQMESMKAGKLDVAFNAVRKPEREEFVHFLNPYTTNATITYVRTVDLPKLKAKNVAKVLDLKNVPDLKIGIIQGYAYGSEVLEALNDPDFKKMTIAVVKYEQYLGMLAKGRINLFFADVTLTSASIKNSKDVKPSDISRYDIKLDKNDAPILYQLLGKKSVSLELAKAIDAAKLKLAKDGTFKKILLKYVTEDDVKMIMVKE